MKAFRGDQSEFYIACEKGNRMFSEISAANLKMILFIFRLLLKWLNSDDSVLLGIVSSM